MDQSLYPGTSTQQLDALVDLLMNFDAYTRQRAPVAPLVEAAAAPPCGCGGINRQDASGCGQARAKE